MGRVGWVLMSLYELYMIGLIYSSGLWVVASIRLGILCVSYKNTFDPSCVDFWVMLV